jgi:hypothetical protein
MTSMKKAFIVLTILCTILSYSALFAQVTQRNILETKYTADQVMQMILPKNQWKPYPLSPDEWKARVPEANLTKIVQDANKLLTYKFEPISATISLDYVRSGDRLRHSNISFKKREVLTYFILAESIENKGRFTEAILNGIWSICEESYWGVPAHIGGTGLPDVENPIVDLFTAETAGVMAIADYLVGDKLDAINKLVRKRMYHETDRRLFTPMMQNGSKYGWMSRTKPVNNWNPWIMSNWIFSSLLLERNEVRRKLMVHSAMKGLDAYFNSLGDEGGCDEGPSYWFAAGASAYDCLELLHSASNGAINIFDHALIRNMAGYITKTHIDEKYFVNFADADPKLTPAGTLLYRFGKAVQDSAMIKMGLWAQTKFPAQGGSTGMRMRMMGSLLALKEMTPLQEYVDAPTSWIKDVQILTARTKSGLFMGTHGGHNAESHNHNDVGDFVIYLKGEPMIVDAGRGNYTARTFSSKRYELWFTRSEYHNLPIVNGIGQKEGRAFEANEVKETINEKESSLSLNIASAYPEAAGIQNWFRKVKLNREKESVEINDEYLLKSNATSLEQVFMTVCKVDSIGAGQLQFTSVNGKVLVLKFDPKLWKVVYDIPSTEGMEYESFNNKWDGKKITRVILQHKKPAAKGKYAFSFVAG